MPNLESTVDKIVEMVEEMQNNSSDWKMHRNLKLAKEVLRMLETMEDPGEGPRGKALACNAVLDELSKYDCPRFCLEIMSKELEWMEESEREFKRDVGLTSEYVRYAISCLKDYIDIEGLTMNDFCSKYNRGLLYDPVERTQKWEDIYVEVEEECDRRLEDVPRGMGFCFAYWSVKANVLKEYGIDWKSPHYMNPGVLFD